MPGASDEKPIKQESPPPVGAPSKKRAAESPGPKSCGSLEDHSPKKPRVQPQHSALKVENETPIAAGGAADSPGSDVYSQLSSSAGPTSSDESSDSDGGDTDWKEEEEGDDEDD